MPSSYSKFKFEDLAALNIKIKDGILFEKKSIPEVVPSAYLTTTLEKNRKKKLRTEKAKSELIITPILNEIEERNALNCAVFSGYNFDVDKSKGLKGYCDYIFTLDPEAHDIEAPVFYVVEAKNENLDTGTPQCIAELYAAYIFNERKGRKLPIIYGAVTFGFQWKFIRFSQMIATIDVDTYYLIELPKILGVLQYIVDIQKPPLSI